MNAAHEEYTNGDLALGRQSDETWITFQGREVFRSCPRWKGSPGFEPGDWMNEVERIAEEIE
jgi:hypothetical protein